MVGEVDRAEGEAMKLCVLCGVRIAWEPCECLDCRALTGGGRLRRDHVTGRTRYANVIPDPNAGRPARYSKSRPLVDRVSCLRMIGEGLRDKEIAAVFGVTAPRIYQIRRESREC